MTRRGSSMARASPTPAWTWTPPPGCSTSWPPPPAAAGPPLTRSDPDHDGVGGPVVQPAQVAIGDERRHDEEQQHRAHQGLAHPDPSAVDPYHPDAQYPLAHGEPGVGREQVRLDR